MERWKGSEEERRERRGGGEKERRSRKEKIEEEWRSKKRGRGKMRDKRPEMDKDRERGKADKIMVKMMMEFQQTERETEAGGFTCASVCPCCAAALNLEDRS
eukprot:766943-Hanusia_phi.AAC.1